MTFLKRSQLIWLLLGTMLLCAMRVATAQTLAPKFEVATIKPAPGADPNTGSWSLPGIGRFTATHVSVELLIKLAYGVDASQIANKPDWLVSDLYDIEAKPEEGVKLTREELKPRLQNLLRERFHLVVHMETRRSRGYALIVAKGVHLTPTKAEHFPGWRTNVSPGEMRGDNWTMAVFAKYLTSAASFPVVDQTGLTGSYDIGFSYEKPDAEDESGRPSLPAAVKEATGLILKPESVPVESVVIDSIDKAPSEN